MLVSELIQEEQIPKYIAFHVLSMIYHHRGDNGTII